MLFETCIACNSDVENYGGSFQSHYAGIRKIKSSIQIKNPYSLVWLRKQQKKSSCNSE